MQRIVIDRPGGYECLRLIESDNPRPGPGQVRIRVAAAGVNYADGIIRMGLYESAKRLHGYPITPGFEVAGEIDALGQGVDTFRIGDRVLALTLFGGYTSHIVLDVDRVFACPARLSLTQAAALPTVFLTAWWMVHEQQRVRSGDRWLVHSAAGGVGGALVQLGKLAGATVIGVVGQAHKLATAQALGCDIVIDKSASDWVEAARAAAPEGFQSIYDANGVSTLASSYRLLAPTGRLCIYGFASMLPRNGRLNWLALARDWLATPRFNPMNLTRDNKSVLACNLSFLSNEKARLLEGMRWLLERFEDGRLVPPTVTEFPLARAADAQRAIESGSTVGKLVLVP